MNAEHQQGSEMALSLARKQVSFSSRVGHLTLLLVASGMSVALTSLLATESHLPTRTYTALSALLLLNISWVVYAAWVLTSRRTMLLNHRVVAGRIALGATTVFTLGAAALGYATGFGAAYLAAALGLSLTMTAAALLFRAQRGLNDLKRRRIELEARLSGLVQ